MSCAIYTNAAGKPGVAVTGLDFSDFNTIAAATINAAAGAYLWVRFAPTTSTVLANGTVYHIVLKSTGGSAGNNYQLQESTAGGTYAGGAVNYGANGSTWTTVAAADLWFRLYAGGAPIQGILDYKLSDGSTERLLIVAGGEVYKEVSGVMTLLSGLDAATMSASADVHPAMNVGGDIAYISDGTVTPKKFFIRGGVEYWANDGISAPTASPTPGVAAGGAVTADTYYIDYFYWDDTLGIASNSRYLGVDTISATTTGGNLTITLTGLPATVVRVGDHATHIKISLRPSASGLYRVGTTAEYKIPLGTTTATITTLALGDEQEYENDPAPIHSIATIGANQRFIAGIKASSSYLPLLTTDIPWRVYGSKLNIVGAFYESFPSLNYRDFGKGDGDYVTALASMPPATLITGMKNSVWALDARRFLIGDPVQISKNVGIAGNGSFMVIGRSLYFVSDAERLKGMMFWNGAQVIPLLAIDKTFKALTPSRIKYATCGHLSPGDDRFQWWTLIAGTNTYQNRVICYDYALDSFTVYRHAGNVLGTASKSAALSKIKIGGELGTLYDADLGATDAGTTISAIFTPKRDDYGSPDGIKRIRFVRAEAEGQSDSHIDVRFEPDLAGFSSFTGHLDFDSPTGSLLGTGILGSFVLSSGTDVIVSARVGINGVCRNAQPTWYSSSRWSLRGYSIAAQVTRRRL